MRCSNQKAAAPQDSQALVSFLQLQFYFICLASHSKHSQGLDHEVVWLDVPMDDLTLLQVFCYLQHFQKQDDNQRLCHLLAYLLGCIGQILCGFKKDRQLALVLGFKGQRIADQSCLIYQRMPATCSAEVIIFHIVGSRPPPPNFKFNKAEK